MLEQSEASKIPKPVISTTIRRKDLKNNRQSSATPTVRGGGASKASDGGVVPCATASKFISLVYMYFCTFIRNFANITE